MNIRKNTNKGITLIALVVAILVLLILATAATLTLFGQKGILEQIDKAGITTELDNISEKINLLSMQNNMDLIFGKTDEATLTYLKNMGIIDSNNKVNADVLLETKTKYGNGIENDIFRLENNKIVYIDSEGNKVAEKHVDVNLLSEYVS